jgi:radical SAM-linked protein
MVAMVAEPPQTVSLPCPEASVPNSRVATSSVPALRWKYRLRFRKGGDLRLVSHHDLMHVFERMLRRAALPIAHTQGFHPQPRMVFALSLALGIAGGNEVLQVELTQSLDPDKLHADLARQAPSGLDIVSVRRLEGGSSSLVRRAFYRLPLQLAAEEYCPAAPADRAQPPEDLSARCLALLEEAHLYIERSRPQPRWLDIRPYLSALRVESGHLEIAVWVTPMGTARPEEFARLLGIEPLLKAGAFFERTDLEMMDESSAPLPRMTLIDKETLKIDEDTAPAPTEPVTGPKTAVRPTALISGPLSFDT